MNKYCWFSKSALHTLYLCSLLFLGCAEQTDLQPDEYSSQYEVSCFHHVESELNQKTYALSSGRSQQKSGEVGCSERTDTGYVNGMPYDIVVVTADGKPAERESANAYWVMYQAAAQTGVDIQISTAFRTYAEQEYLYNCYLNQNCNNGNLAAAPGYSNHQSGHAFDFRVERPGVLDWLRNNGATYGFENTIRSEPWHWEWWGGGPGGGPCQGQPCDELGAEGGILDNSGACFQKFGPSQYWRSVDEGEQGQLFWTNAFNASEPDNWARWNIHLSEAGEYRVEVSVSQEYGLCTDTPYLIKHDGQESRLSHDQSASEYWQELGVFTFAAGGDQHVDVYDNIPGWSQMGQHITADAIRLTRVRQDIEEPEIQAGEMNEEPEIQAGEMNGGVIVEPEAMAGEVIAGEMIAGTEPEMGGEDIEETMPTMNMTDTEQGGSDRYMPASEGPVMLNPLEPVESDATGGASCEQRSSLLQTTMGLCFIFMSILYLRRREV